MVATNDVLFHVPERRVLQDVLTCIREHGTDDAVGFWRNRFADRCLKPPQEMTFKRDAVRPNIGRTGECSQARQEPVRKMIFDGIDLDL
jgi:error-prone DNA polymerase